MTMLSTIEAAERLERSETWVQKAVKRGELRATTRPKNWGGGHRIEIPIDAVDDYLRKHAALTAGKINAEDAAARAGVAVSTLHKAVRRGELPVVRVARQKQNGNPNISMFEPADIDRWVAEKPLREAEALRRQIEGGRIGAALGGRPRLPVATPKVVVVSKKAKPTVDDAVTPTPVAAPPRPVRMQEPPTNKRPAPKQFRNTTDIQEARRLWEGMRAIWAADKKRWAADLREIIAWEKAHPKSERVVIDGEVPV